MSKIKPTWLLPDSVELLSQPELQLLERWVAFLLENQPPFVSRIRNFIQDHPVETGSGYEIYIYDVHAMSIMIHTEDQTHQEALFEGNIREHALWPEDLEPTPRFYEEQQRLTNFWLADSWQKTAIVLEGRSVHIRSYSDLAGMNLKNFFCCSIADGVHQKQESDLTEEELLLRTHHALRYETTYSWLLVNESGDFVEIGMTRSKLYRGFGKGNTTVNAEKKRIIMEQIEELAATWFHEAVAQGYRCVPYPPGFERVNLI